LSGVREFPRLDLHYEAETPSGRFYRWAKDEVRPENVPSGAGFSTTDHGGFDSQNLTLPRKPGEEYADLERLTTIRALGAGGEVACETRLKEAPRTSGDQISVSPVAEGWIEHLGDNQTAAEIYRDVDLNGWGGPGRARQVALEAVNLPPTGVSEVLVDPISGLPALRLHVDGFWASPVIQLVETWYDAGSSATVSKVYYDFAGGSSTTTAFILVWGSSDTDTGAGGEESGDIFTALSATGTAVSSAGRRFFHWGWRFNATASGAEGYTYPVDLRHLAVYGSHGLTLQGTEPEAGFTGDQILGNALPRWASLLNFSIGSTGTIRPGSFVIPHLSFKEQTTTLAILEGVNRFELRPYMVWENRTFYWQEWGEGRKWRARVAPTQLSETGPSTDRLRNGVLLKWNDVDGTSRSAGPIGSGSDIESSELEDRDPENPLNQMGIPGWGTPYDLGIVTVDSEAIRIGVLLQARLKEVDHSGQAQIVGVCEDDKGVLRPAWQVRAGDTFTPIDAAEPTERRIIATQYDDDSRTNTITLDAPPDAIDDLLAQLGVGNTELGL
jgi:hypothetical protein